MIRNTIGILQRAADLGLKLGIEEGDTLTYEPVDKCPWEFRETLRTNKPELLELLQLPFVMVDSEILGETIFFCANDDTRTALIEAGAEEWSIYTRAELQILCEHNRVAPFSAAELRKVHEIKRIFNARITPQ